MGGWMAGSQCRSRSIALYKHRVSVPVALPGVVAGELGDALHDMTEASAVGAELLGLRNSGGHARFVLLPSPPKEPSYVVKSRDSLNGSHMPTDANAAGVEGEALELRIVVAELIMLGPVVHRPVLESGSEDETKATPSQRAAKVYYRRRPCAA